MHLEMEAFSFGIAIYSLDLMNGVYLMTCNCPASALHSECGLESGGTQRRHSLTAAGFHNMEAFRAGPA